MDILNNVFLLEFLKSKGCKLLREEKYARGALREYSSGNLRLLLIIDGGVFEFLMSSEFQPDVHYPVSFLKDIQNPAPQGRWNLNLEQNIAFLNENWDTLQNNFNKNNFRKTSKELEVH